MSGHDAQLECLVGESHFVLTICEDSPGGNSFRFDSDNLLHDADGIRPLPVDVRLVSLADHAFYLLREGRTGISFSLSSNFSYAIGHSGATVRGVQFSSSFGRLLTPPSTHLASRLHHSRSDPKLD